MATEVVLKAGRREGRGKGQARKLRAEGQLPAVLYGAGQDPLSLTLSAHETLHLFRSISVDNTIISLEVEGEEAPVPALVREIQAHPARPGLLHVDFLRIQSGVEVELDVPVRLEGIPTGVTDEGGVLEQTIHQIPVRCLPADIPEAFTVDVAELEIGGSIRVENITLPERLEILIDGQRTVCSVQVPTELIVEEPEEEDIEGELVDEEVEEVEKSEESAESEDEGE